MRRFALARYFGRRLAELGAVWLGITALAFLIGHLAPGDPGEGILAGELGRLPTHSELAAFDARLGLDRPLVIQYLAWVWGALHGNLGVSYVSGQQVSAVLTSRLPATMLLACCSLMLTVILALPLGTWAGLRSGRLPDGLTRAMAVGSAAMPSFWAGYLLIILFAVSVPMLPAQGDNGARSLVLPVITLTAAIVGIPLRIVRSSVVEVLNQDYVRTARAVGTPARTVITRHVLRNALMPFVTYLGLIFAMLLSGAVVVETVFAWPGIGLTVTTAIHNRNYPVVQGFVLFAGTAFVVVNVAVDLIYAWLDPRVRLGARAG